MSFTPNRIVLIGYAGRKEEAPNDLTTNTNIYPGMSVIKLTNGNVIPNNVQGAGPSPLAIATEDALQGLDATQALTPGNVIPFYYPGKGDKFLCLLQNGQNVTQGTGLMSAGDGTFKANPGAKMYQITAASTALVNTSTETTFSNGSFSIPANTLQVGDVFHIRAKVICNGVTATPTLTVKLYFGGTTVVVSSGAISVIAADVIVIDAWVTVTAITSAGTIIADGMFFSSATGTFTTTSFTLASTTTDSTIAEVVKVTGKWSAASTSDTCTLNEFQIDLNRTGGVNTLVIADEAINNSAGAGSSPMSAFSSAAFIRCLVP